MLSSVSRITAAVSAASSTLADFKCDFKAAQERQEYTQGACMAAQHDFKKHSANSAYCYIALSIYQNQFYYDGHVDSC